MEYLFYGASSSLFSWVFVVVFVILFSRVSRLSRTVEDLKNQISSLKRPESLANQETAKTPLKFNTYGNVTNVQKALDEIPRDTVTSVTNEMKQIKASGDISNWFKDNILLKIGVLMIIIGFGWFVNYAFAHNWIGPVGRITLGVLLGSILTIIGTLRLPKNLVQGNAFTILGSAILILTLLAGSYIYNFFSPTVLVSFVFVVSLYITLSAVAYSYQKLAVYGILVSLGAPLLSPASTTMVVLYFYLLIVSLSTIWISIVKDWRNITAIGITGVFLYGLQIVLGGASHDLFKYIILITVYVTSGLYLTVNIWGLIKNKVELEGVDVYLSVINTAIILGFTNSIVPTVYKSLIIAAWMLVYAFSGFFVFMKTKRENLFYIHALISILLLAVATSIELSGPTLVIAFAIEASIIAVSAFIVTNNIEISQKMGLLLVGPFVMSLQSIYSSSWLKGILHSDFAVLLVMSVCTGLLGMFYSMNKRGETNTEIKMYSIAYILSTFYIYAIIWLSSQFLFEKDTAVFMSLFIYTIIGLVTHFYGIFNHNSMMKKYGMTLLILVVIRLVLVDVWNMELMLRVITFIVLGAMFMSSAFISKSQKNNFILIKN